MSSLLYNTLHLSLHHLSLSCHIQGLLKSQHSLRSHMKTFICLWSSHGTSHCPSYALYLVCTGNVNSSCLDTQKYPFLEEGALYCLAKSLLSPTQPKLSTMHHTAGVQQMLDSVNWGEVRQSAWAARNRNKLRESNSPRKSKEAWGTVRWYHVWHRRMTLWGDTGDKVLFWTIMSCMDLEKSL
jgi:hypothetical protein